MITADNIRSHEFIGLNTEICESTNPQVIGLNGRIINETKSMFTINTENGMRSIAKDTCSWKFTVQDKSMIVKGTSITKRSFDRLGGKA